MWMLKVGEKKLQKHKTFIFPFSQPEVFMFSASCTQSIWVHPERWYRNLRFFVQWLSHVLCPVVSFCWLMLRRFLTLHLQLPVTLICASVHVIYGLWVLQGPTRFWQENHQKSTYSRVSPYCLSRMPLAVLIRKTLACSSKIFGFFHWCLNRFQH